MKNTIPQDTESMPLECCLYVMDKRDISDGKNTFCQTLIGGVIISDSTLVTFPISKVNGAEMWRGSILIFPREKYYGATNFKGMRIDQVLCSGYARPDMWEGKIINNIRVPNLVEEK